MYYQDIRLNKMNPIVEINIYLKSTTDQTGENAAWGNPHYYSIKIWSTMNEKRASRKKQDV